MVGKLAQVTMKTGRYDAEELLNECMQLPQCRDEEPISGACARRASVVANFRLSGWASWCHLGNRFALKPFLANENRQL